MAWWWPSCEVVMMADWREIAEVLMQSVRRELPSGIWVNAVYDFDHMIFQIKARDRRWGEGAGVPYVTFGVSAEMLHREHDLGALRDAVVVQLIHGVNQINDKRAADPRPHGRMWNEFLDNLIEPERFQKEYLGEYQHGHLYDGLAYAGLREMGRGHPIVTWMHRKDEETALVSAGLPKTIFTELPPCEDQTVLVRLLEVAWGHK